MTYEPPTELPLGPETVAYRVNTEPVPFLGGGRALLLQVAHPKVAAGVEQHSAYASDPWGRLFRTVDVMLKLAFASPEVSARQARKLAMMHERVRGIADDGEPYDALDPALLVWVWATLVDTALVCYERIFGALPVEDRTRYYDESKLVAYACGVPRDGCPESWAEFDAYMRRMIETELRATPAGLMVARATMTPPLPAPLGALAGVPLRLVTAGLLPPSLREAFGFPWDSARERRLDAFFAAARRGLPIVPEGVRRFPSLWLINRRRPLRIGWLQRKGAKLTAERLGASSRTKA
ncbi:MAG TPA: oxygenase MpaB family protein [Acidimicrobiales bacterium]|nr:oxygenase MpaB family protein [Acidimicrobiales bacterium]